MPTKYICEDCRDNPGNEALRHFKQKSVAERHAERTGHTIIEKAEQ